MSDGREVRQRLERIEGLVRAVDETADPTARANALELMRSLMDLHGAGIERMLEIAFEAGGNALVDRLAADELVESLLLVYGLHPLPVESRVLRALDEVRPRLRAQESDVELLGVEEGVVRLRIRTSANGRAAAIRQTVEEAVAASTPDAAGVDVEIDEPLRLVTLQPSKQKRTKDEGRRTNPTGTPLLTHPSSFVLHPSEAAAAEKCALCGAALGDDHEHLVDPPTKTLVCACGPCALLFSSAGGKYRRVPKRVRSLPGFFLTDAQWDSLMIPIQLAFFFHSTAASKVVAVYPSPAGPTESLLPLAPWDDIVLANPVLRNAEPDVEALLVNRMPRQASGPEYFLVPVDECYRLTGLVRAYWRGLSGGTAVWDEIERFFGALRARSAAAGGVAHA